MRPLSTLAALLLLAACSDSGSGQTDSAVPDTGGQSDGTGADRAAADSTSVDGPAADRPLLDGPGLDQVLLDRGLLDAPVADATPDARPRDQASGDGPKPTLTAKLGKVLVWANLMPMVPPDPTIVTINLSLTNTAKVNATGVKLVDTKIIPPSPGKPQAITMKADKGFSGVVKAGATIQADFRKVQSTTSTPLPATCKDKVQVSTTVAYSGGKVGPLLSGQVVFSCVY